MQVLEIENTHCIGVQFDILREMLSPLGGIALRWETPSQVHTPRNLNVLCSRLLKGIFFSAFMLFLLNLLWRTSFFAFMQLALHNN